LDELDDVGEASETVFDLEDDPFDAEIVGTKADPDEEDAEEENLSDISSEDEPDLDDDRVITEPPRDTGHIKDMVAKLDAVLKLVFDHLCASHGEPLVSPSPAQTLSDVTSQPTPKPQPPLLSPPNLAGTECLFEAQHAQFRTLLFAFERTVLRTSKSRYTQFLLFWFASLHINFADEFLGTLIHKVITVSESHAIRAAAASYLASFVSRARYVDGDNVRRVMRLLCTYLARELELYAEQKEAVHISLFTPFYTVSQAVFLIFCFRWRDLKEPLEEDGRYEDEEANDDLGLNAAAMNAKQGSWISELDILQRVIVSPLNPLRVSTSIYAPSLPLRL
jgi:RNA polymerase I-specific transcription initiation factor RRN3